MEVKLIGVSTPSTPSPVTDLIVASARSCYSPTPVAPEQVTNWPKKRELLLSLFEAGHHTTFIHPTFTFLISGISRLLIWRLLHSHPYYNSEQVSQRYARLSPDSFYIPEGVDRQRWRRFYNFCYSRYRELVEKLTPEMERKLPAFRKKEGVKKAQEFARYLIPLGATAHLYHSVNLLTVLRYIAGVKSLPEGREEGEELARRLEEILVSLDPELEPILEEVRKEKGEFPEIDLGELWAESKIEGSGAKILEIDRPPVSTPLPPFRAGENYGGVLKLFTLYPDLEGITGFTSYLQLSLSADAQNQRHRRSVGVREPLEKSYRRDVVYYTPPPIENSPFRNFYWESMEEIYRFVEEELRHHPFEKVAYALPNAHIIPVVERTDFSAFVHKAQMRLCYNAQEEIFRLTYQQIEGLREKGIDISLFQPPCVVRKRMEIKPYCPEGVRFCGVKVWKVPFEKLKESRPL